ncbi:MAG: hypothetical protein ACFFDH_12085 [Promethearchaeota archaeon]
MPCIHGLDETNCPTCRILKSTVPLRGINLKKTNFLNANEMFSKKNLRLEKKITEDITINKANPNTPNLLSKPSFINDIPNFGNKLFLERFKDLDISKEDDYEINKKIPLESPEWEFEEKY